MVRISLDHEFRNSNYRIPPIESHPSHLETPRMMYYTQVAAKRMSQMATARDDEAGTIILHLQNFKDAKKWNHALSKEGWKFLKSVVVGCIGGTKRFGPNCKTHMPRHCDHFYIWQRNSEGEEGVYRNNFMWYRAHAMRTGQDAKDEKALGGQGGKKKKKGEGETGKGKEKTQEERMLEIGDEDEGGGGEEGKASDASGEEAKRKSISPAEWWKDHHTLQHQQFQVSKSERLLFERVSYIFVVVRVCGGRTHVCM
jgi:hypothetical protein